MTGRWKGAFATGLWAVGLGVIVASLDGQPQRFSLELWLAAGSSFLIMILALRLLRSAGPASSADLDIGRDFRALVRKGAHRIWSLITRRQSTPEVAQSPTPVAFQTLSGLLDLSYESERMFVRRLRPRLQALADHFLPLRHGVDAADLAATRRVLGESSWLLEDGSQQRCPAPDDIDRFLSALLAESDLGERGATS